MDIKSSEFLKSIDKVFTDITLYVVGLVKVYNYPAEALVCGLLKVAATIGYTTGCSREHFLKLSGLIYDQEAKINKDMDDLNNDTKLN